MPMKVNVSLGKRSYPILIGDGAVRELPRSLKKFKSKTAFIVADRRLAGARKAVVQTLTRAGFRCREIPVHAGEQLKDFKSVLPLYRTLLEEGARRDAVLVAVGGGTIGDAAGFVASTYMRGIPWVGVPTTLLAQVDSAIGGKTAVNCGGAKNIVGTFHQPAAVVCDVNFLKTLSRRELISGLGEAIKYGLIYDKTLFKYIANNWDKALHCDARVLTFIVRRSAYWKARVVAADEFDVKGVREFLNFGHTMGHALESVTNYRQFQHGEAVLWGMRYALALSEIKGGLSSDERAKIEDFLSRIALPSLPRSDVGLLARTFKKDKKVRAGKINFVLLRGLAKPYSCNTVTGREIKAAYDLMIAGDRR